jgi:hypothetical protein
MSVSMFRDPLCYFPNGEEGELDDYTVEVLPDSYGCGHIKQTSLAASFLWPKSVSQNVNSAMKFATLRPSPKPSFSLHEALHEA